MTGGPLERIHRVHQRCPWWDGEVVPHLANLKGQWAPNWQDDLNRRRELVEAAQSYLENQRGISEPDAATLVPHALACVANWPYVDPLCSGSFTVPVRFFAGLDGFEWCRPDDETPFMPPVYGGFLEAWQDPRGGVWRRQGRQPLQMRGRSANMETDREAARLKDEEGWTHAQIGERFGWPIQTDDAGSRRCRTSEQAVKRGRK